MIMKLNIKYDGLLNFPAIYTKNDFLDRVKKISGYKNIRKEPKYLSIINNYYDVYERLIEYQSMINSLNLEIRDLRKRGVDIMPSKNRGTELEALNLFTLKDKLKSAESGFEIIEKRYKRSDVKFATVDNLISQIEDENNSDTKGILYLKVMFLIKSYVSY